MKLLTISLLGFITLSCSLQEPDKAQKGIIDHVELQLSDSLDENKSTDLSSEKGNPADCHLLLNSVRETYGYSSDLSLVYDLEEYYNGNTHLNRRENTATTVRVPVPNLGLVGGRYNSSVVKEYANSFRSGKKEKLSIEERMDIYRTFIKTEDLALVMPMINKCIEAERESNNRGPYMSLEVNDSSRVIITYRALKNEEVKEDSFTVRKIVYNSDVLKYDSQNSDFMDNGNYAYRGSYTLQFQRLKLDATKVTVTRVVGEPVNQDVPSPERCYKYTQQEKLPIPLVYDKARGKLHITDLSGKKSVVQVGVHNTLTYTIWLKLNSAETRVLNTEITSKTGSMTKQPTNVKSVLGPKGEIGIEIQITLARKPWYGQLNIDLERDVEVCEY